VSAEKLAAIHSYLTRAFPGRFIEQRHDRERDAQSFKVHLERGTLLLKVGDAFVSDRAPDEIVAKLERWGVAAMLSRDRDTGVLVVTEGPSVFSRA
jgi:hypothetical protein